MIEGGVAGSSAREQASQRRAAADRLLYEARRWEQLAADRAETAGQLDALPPAYAVLHDLMVSGSATGVDHVVVGPGGAFLVMSRRYQEAIAYRDGQLWAGQVSLHHDVDEARLEAQRLTHLLGSPVVPLLAFLHAVMPAAAPRAIEGVLVTGGDTVVRVITRASHTLLTSPQVADIVERALPVLHSPGSVVRSVSSKGTPRDPQPDPSVHPTVPGAAAEPVITAARGAAAPDSAPDAAVTPSSPGRWARRSAAREERRATRHADRSERAAARKESRAAHPDTDELARVPAHTTVVPAVAAASAGRGQRSRSLRLVVGVLLVLCLVAVGLGTAARLWWKNDDADSATAPSTPATSIAPAPSTTVGSAVEPVNPPVAAVVVPLPRLLPSCPVAGAGWTVSIGFPGSQAGVTHYDVELQQLDSTWRSVGVLTAEAPSVDLATGQPVGALWVLRLVAVTDTGRSVGESALLGPPTTPC